MTTDRERGTNFFRVHGRDPLPAHAAGRAVLFTGLIDPADVFWLTFMVACVGVTGYVLVGGTQGEVFETVYLAVVFVVWLDLVRRFVSPFRVLVGLEEVTEWRWYGRRTLPIRKAVATANRGRHGSLIRRRSKALAEGLDPALLQASEWLDDTKAGQEFRDREADERMPPMAILAVGEDVVPVVDREVWLDWRVQGGTTWRLAPERLRAVTGGASIVLVPRTWNEKYRYHEYADEPILLAGPNSDVEALRARLAALH